MPVCLLLLALAAPPLAPAALAQDAGTDGRLVVEADDSLEWQRDRQLYIASGNAVARQGDVTLKADRIEARYRGGEAAQAGSGGGDIEITHIVGISGAELRDAAVTARADRVMYDIDAGMAQLTGGRPSIATAGESVTAAGSITYDWNKREAVAEGQVEVRLDGGRRLKAARVLATVDGEEDTLTFIRASGDAEVSAPGAAGDRKANADEIEYSRATGVAVLTGSVTIADGDNSMAGDRAEIDLASGTSSVTAESGRVVGVFSPDR